MKCEICPKEFYDTLDGLTERIIHTIIFHPAEEINGPNYEDYDGETMTIEPEDVVPVDEELSNTQD